MRNVERLQDVAKLRARLVAYAKSSVTMLDQHVCPVRLLAVIATT